MQWFGVLCVGLFIRAVGGSVNWTYSTIIIQKTAPDAKLGRMFALDLAGFQLATVLSTLVHGALVDLVGLDQLWRIAAATGMVSLLPLVLWLWWERYSTPESKKHVG
jgi:MFS family permease